ncbi:MAG: bis-aminopropyl spermidine synthase family protein [Candidatus Omnitrophica bacterium]|nr:bis-aminopropyl spermidine synthase family protein [Candidatus Omnitrophota bacterium]
MTLSEPEPTGVKSEWLAELAQAIRLREGVEGITRALWALYGGKIFSTRDWTAAVQIPVPVLAALRRELEKRDILIQGKKLQLSEAGMEKLESLFGRQEKIDAQCPACQGGGRILPPEVMPVLEEFREICDKRPRVDVTLDQSHATPETGVRKALLLMEKGLLMRPLLFIGDDDLISVACHLVRNRFMPNAQEAAAITVLDIDARYLELIRQASQGQIQVREYDVRQELPEDLHDRFSAVLTDPAYTENGITAFAYRSWRALEEAGSLFLSMPFADGPSLHSIQNNLVQMGFAFRDILIGFNRYKGASIHASRTNLLIAEKIRSTPEKSFRLRYTPFYTGEVRPPRSVYACTMCKTPYPVGPEEAFPTIFDLKKAGCKECGNDSFQRLNSREANESNRSPSQED